MRSFFFKNPIWLQWLQKDVLWSVATNEKVIFLTFDDGPTPDVTRFVLDTLDLYQAKATFFCIGKNLRENPDLGFEIQHKDHVIGNHTYHHLNGWKTTDQEYLRDVKLFDAIRETPYFRPPYGKISRSQKRLIPEKKVIMWSHMSGDFVPGLKTKKVLKILLKARPGSIMVFHDSYKAFGNLEKLLPTVLSHFSDLGYSFKTLDGYATN